MEKKEADGFFCAGSPTPSFCGLQPIFFSFQPELRYPTIRFKFNVHESVDIPFDAQ